MSEEEEELMKEQIREIYRQHNPAKLGELDGLFVRYIELKPGGLAEMLSDVREKYLNKESLDILRGGGGGGTAYILHSPSSASSFSAAATMGGGGGGALLSAVIKPTFKSHDIVYFVFN